jgi:hypothetical protein
MFSDLWWFAFFGMVNFFVWSNALLLFGLLYLDYRLNRDDSGDRKFVHHIGGLLKGDN